MNLATTDNPSRGATDDGVPVTIADLRRMPKADLERVGRASLRGHLLAQAEVARHKHGPVTAGRLDALLRDPACLRHPVRLVYEFGEMAMHQFAQPDVDWRNRAEDGRVLYLRPALRDRPDLLPLAIVYMIPLINFGEIVSDADCLAYGAVLLGLSVEDYYGRVCALADLVGADDRRAGGDFATE
jgi:hypothetical protein